MTDPWWKWVLGSLYYCLGGAIVGTLGLAALILFVTAPVWLGR